MGYAKVIKIKTNENKNVFTLTPQPNRTADHPAKAKGGLRLQAPLPRPGAAAAPGHSGDSRRNDYANPHAPRYLSRGNAVKAWDACGLIATPLPGWPAASTLLQTTSSTATSATARARI